MKKIFISILAILMMAAASPEKKGYEVGDVAADFKLKNVDGKLVSLADRRASCRERVCSTV